MLEQSIQCELCKASLSLGSQNSMTLSTAGNTECSQQSISAFSPASAQYSLDHGQCTSLLEQIQLTCIFLKNAREAEPLYRSLSLVVRRRLDRDMCWCYCLRVSLDVQKSFARGIGRAKAQIDIEKGRARSLHFDVALCVCYRS